MTSQLEQLRALHARLERCERCPKMLRPVVHGAAVVSDVFLLGQAPGVREGPAGKPFAWTAGKTLFGWFHEALGVDEETVRARVYIAAVARCFPGKHPKGGGGDRKPDPREVETCRTWLEEEVALLRPKLVLPVGALAITQVLGHEGPLAEVVGRLHRVRWHGVDVEVLPLPHPSGASTWHRTEPGKTLLARSLKLLGRHALGRAIARGE
ncbi:MAG: uracil-DNA glycosylase family protein [Myxococcales bacterium]|nr:uracil-DNA glycosylase family protein [Myxococcales bacterium]